MKRIAIYLRVSTPQQNLEMQRFDLEKFATEKGFTIVREFSDVASGTKAKRTGLESLLRDVKSSRHDYDGIAVWSGDRIARSVRDFLSILDTLGQHGVEYFSLREGFTTDGPMGRAFTIMVGMMAEVEAGILRSRIQSGMARYKALGGRLGRTPLNIDRDQLVRDRLSGMSLTQVAKKHRVSRATVCRLVKKIRGGSQGVLESGLQPIDFKQTEIAA
jgi:putative DNA-invertase from lambdoid prophage Rac